MSGFEFPTGCPDPRVEAEWLMQKEIVRQMKAATKPLMTIERQGVTIQTEEPHDPGWVRFVGTFMFTGGVVVGALLGMWIG